MTTHLMVDIETLGTRPGAVVMSVALVRFVDAILNALHEMAARVAIAAGTEPEASAQGMKYHWDNLANAINADAESTHVN